MQPQSERKFLCHEFLKVSISTLNDSRSTRGTLQPLLKITRRIQRRHHLKALLQALAPPRSACLYFRASRCHIVKLDHVANVTPSSTGAVTLQLNDGLRLEMSRRRAADFKQLMHV
ncbi:MAG: hypothetical protein B7X59_06590 [Polaromonas sp. 39-63-203]|nr:MAG: hypothetical protein B7Y54_03550 [Polaromonas sp. 35-63-240]OYZ02029.1 MAG: hypothetical protein B7Y42_02855 [Polaromonas sp. 28-63-22]OYZ84430.1 MAG: hypothetical protein B7Y03_03780 [Polaromonas sp. 24-62-144]OZA98115.1 MAG: hypothetical protein B7X59_06590 [Polaromonas sp. 39-63-203]